jgi:hypothetical protein
VIDFAPTTCRSRASRAGRSRWAAMALGTGGAELSDVGPPELVAVLRDWSERFARAGNRER